jgi:hypothetical protein
MDNDSRPFDHAAADAPGLAPTTAQTSGEAVVDGFAEIGYEAADPWLHAPLWREAMQACPAPRDRR